MCFDDSYAPRPTAYREEWRTARKQHDCCECGLPIHRGERYRHTWGVWDGDMMTAKQCAVCTWWIERIEKSELEAGCRPQESRPGIGGLHDALYEGHDRSIGLVPLEMVG